MATFRNTSYKNTVETLVDGFKDRLKNPYYMFTDKQPTLTDYFNQNTSKSTLDDGIKQAYSHLGKNSPIKFNKIVNFCMYGLDRIGIELENGEYGLESTGIEGEGFILPNTIVPIANDFFIIKHASTKLLFKITEVSINTLENGANFYRVQYKLDQLETETINNQVEDEFEMIVDNVGTQFKSIIRKTDYNYVEELDVMITRLKTYYCNLFYSERVQTFILPHNGDLFYDSYLIEFLIRNKITPKEKNFIYITHQVYIPATFSIDYDRTIFSLIERPYLNNNKKPRCLAQGEYIDEYLSILSSRSEDYFQMKYVDSSMIQSPYLQTIELIDQQMLDNIYTGELYKDSNYKNIIIKYFNKKPLNSDDLVSIEDIDYAQNISLFYEIPMLIYILQADVNNKLKTNK